MRKLLMMVCAVSLGYASQAQTTKGNVTFTGILGYTQYRSTDDHKYDVIPFEGFEPRRNTQSSFTLSPSIGYFIKDNLEIGISVFSSHTKSEIINHYGSYDNGIVTITGQHHSLSNLKQKGLNVYAKQYKFLTSKIAMHGTLSAGQNKVSSNRVFTSTSTTTHSSEQDDQHSTFAAALSPGFTFFASRKIGLNANLGALTYNRFKREETSVYRDSNYPQPSVQESPSYSSNSLTFGFSSMHLNFGLTYFIGK